MTSPTLYHKGKGGALYQWRVWTEGAAIYTEYGQVGGKLQVSAPTIATPKNVGRSNETTPEQQADLEAEAMFKFKLERKYSLTPEGAAEPLMLPMLAHEFGKKKKKIIYPVDMQPKLDGLRCMSKPEDNAIRLISRQGKDYEVPAVILQLHSLQAELPPDWILDGELYIHGVGFQTLTSWIKKLRPETTQVEYHIYDVPMWDGIDNLPWGDRVNILGHVGKLIDDRGFKNLKVVPTYAAENEAQVHFWQSQFVEHGYEGGIARDRRGVYLFGYRSSELLKVKEFVDAEFPICGFEDGDGKFEGCVKWICQILPGMQYPDGKDGTYTATREMTFTAVPTGSMEQRAEWYRNGKTFLGQMLKVKYFELTDEFKPRFPVGLGIRIPEDMDARTPTQSLDFLDSLLADAE